MAIGKAIYGALQDVVGKENILEDPAILDSQAWAFGGGRFTPRFEAITLPQTAEEVQAIVKLCNRHKIQFKVTSTHWGPTNDPTGPGYILMDLRRMNRILEINEKNMYAVVEPHVISARLQAELMKRGLNCNINGAGGQTSALPPVAYGGIGHMSQNTGTNTRNMLAAEWITPEGEIVRMGSLGSIGEWFCGDGPGISLRGVVKGSSATLGGIGVVTKAATKVYHWPGPATFPIEGQSPHYRPSKIPEGFLVRYYSFQTKQLADQAQRKIGESEIGFALMGFTPGMVASNIATSNEEDIQYLEQFRTLAQGPGFWVMIAGNSPRDFEYKREALKQIIDETGGKSLQPLENPDLQGGFLWRCIRVTSSIRECYRAAITSGGAQGGMDVWKLQVDCFEKVAESKREMIAKGILRDDGGYILTQSLEHGHLGHAEILVMGTATPEAAKAGFLLVAKTNEVSIEGHFGVPHHVSGDRQHEQFGPHTSNYHLWLRKIKEKFDPNNAADPTFYITAKK